MADRIKCGHVTVLFSPIALSQLTAMIYALTIAVVSDGTPAWPVVSETKKPCTVIRCPSTGVPKRSVQSFVISTEPVVAVSTPMKRKRFLTNTRPGPTLGVAFTNSAKPVGIVVGEISNDIAGVPAAAVRSVTISSGMATGAGGSSIVL